MLIQVTIFSINQYKNEKKKFFKRRYQNKSDIITFTTEYKRNYQKNIKFKEKMDNLNINFLFIQNVGMWEAMQKLIICVKYDDNVITIRETYSTIIFHYLLSLDF